MPETKNVVITGVCGGIGQAMLHQFLRKGFRVIGVDIQEKGLQKLLDTHGEHFVPYRADLLQRDKRKALSQEILDDWGVPQIWINNAGIAEIEEFVNCSEAAFDRVMEINFNASVDLTRFWLPLMRNLDRGKIVNIASCAGHMPVPQLSSYAASKHAVVGFTQSLQQELKSEHSRVKMILVSPGFVNTQIIRLGQDKGFPSILSFVPESPERCAQEIVQGVLRGKSFIAPTINGKLLLGLNRISPEMTRLSSHLLVAPQLKSLFGFLDAR